MARMDVLPYPNPFLRKRAQDVAVFDEALTRLVGDMSETMAAEDGLGLAATQVGVDMRLLLLSPIAFRGDEARGEPDVVVINPEIIEKSEETITAEKGCLSFPGVYINVARPRRVKIRAQDAQGEFFEIEAEDLGARAILHEIDHIDGVVMIDHVSHFVRTRALKKHNKLQAEKRAESQPAGRKGKPPARNRRR